MASTEGVLRSSDESTPHAHRFPTSDRSFGSVRLKSDLAAALAIVCLFVLPVQAAESRAFLCVFSQTNGTDANTLGKRVIVRIDQTGTLSGVSVPGAGRQADCTRAQDTLSCPFPLIGRSLTLDVKTLRMTVPQGRGDDVAVADCEAALF